MSNETDKELAERVLVIRDYPPEKSASWMEDARELARRLLARVEAQEVTPSIRATVTNNGFCCEVKLGDELIGNWSNSHRPLFRDHTITPETAAKNYAARVNAALVGGVEAFSCHHETKPGTACTRWCGNSKCHFALKESPSPIAAANEVMGLRVNLVPGAPDDQMVLMSRNANGSIAAAVAGEREACIEACLAEKVGLIGEGDEVYNMAIEHCVEAIRARSNGDGGGE